MAVFLGLRLLSLSGQYRGKGKNRRFSGLFADLRIFFCFLSTFRAPIARRDCWDWIAPLALIAPRIPFAKIRIFGIAFVMVARAMIAPLVLIAPRRACARAGLPAGVVFFAPADPPEGVDGSLDIHTLNFDFFVILEP